MRATQRLHRAALRGQLDGCIWLVTLICGAALIIGLIADWLFG